MSMLFHSQKISVNEEKGHTNSDKIETVKLLKGHLQLILLVATIILCAIRITYIFSTQKQGYHSDEVWNYGLANSYYSPHLYMDGLSQELINCDKWESSGVFQEYLTVNKNERFSYDSVIHNQIMDLNPPLYFMALHTISSLFPEIYSRWFAYVINLIVFILTMLYIYRCVRLIHEDAYAGIVTILYYGLCIGALNIYLFLRFYATVAMWTTMFTYYTVWLYKNRNSTGKEISKEIALVILCTFFGALTAHIFLIYAFCLTALFSLLFLFLKKFRLFLIYGIGEAGAVLFSVFAFPATIAHLSGNHGYNIASKYDLFLQFKMCISFLTKELFGLHTSIYKTMAGTYLFYGSLIAAFFLIPTIFLCRNEKWFIQCKSRVKDRMKYGMKQLKMFDFSIFFILISSIFEVAIVSRTVSVYHMTEYTDRYLFCIYPVIIIALGSMCFYLLKWMIHSSLRRYIFLIVASVILICNNKMSKTIYCFEKDENAVDIRNVTMGCNVVLVLSDRWLLTCYANELLNAEQFYSTDYTQCLKQEQFKNKVKPFPSDRPVYVLLDTSQLKNMELSDANVESDSKVVLVGGEELTESFQDGQKIMKSIRQLSDQGIMEYVGFDQIFGRNIMIYQLK